MTMIKINSNEIIWHSSFYDFNDNDNDNDNYLETSSDYDRGRL